MPGEGEALVRIHAASVNAADIEWMKGLFLVRYMGSAGNTVLGSDMAGTVESVGAGTTRFQSGDVVMADLYSIGKGAFAEYVCVRESELRFKPAHLTFTKAATLPQAGVCALQGIRTGDIRDGDAVLINGAGGGMGSFAIQIAKSMGAEITTVDRADKFDLMYSLGVKRCIDFRQQDYTQTGDSYDFILDLNADKKISVYRSALKPGGVFTVVGGKPKTILSAQIAGSMKTRDGKRFGLMMWKPNDSADMARLGEMTEQGILSPAIDRTYDLRDAAEAIRYCWQGYAKGKVVITMEREKVI